MLSARFRSGLGATPGNACFFRKYPEDKFDRAREILSALDDFAGAGISSIERQSGPEFSAVSAEIDRVRLSHALKRIDLIISSGAICRESRNRFIEQGYLIIP